MAQLVIGVLGFDPYSKEKKSFMVDMTPTMANYILTHHNADNRKIVQLQLGAIRKSAAEFGWMWDGGACVFTTSGNIIEFQHRLRIIVERDVTVKVLIVTGVDPEVFVRAAPAKNRTITDVINKKDKSATSDQVTTLRQVLKRMAGESPQSNSCPKLTMQTANQLWSEWKDNILEGMELTKTLFDGKVSNYSPWQRQFNAWATLMVHTGHADKIIPFLELLKSYKLGKTVVLFAEMDYWFKEYTYELSGENKAAAVHFMLCYATDKFLQDSNGKTQFDLKNTDANHVGMIKKNGTYRSFLHNPKVA